MPLESTIICMDNSEWMRNGDYQPTRIEAQQDAANLVANAKMQSNPESTVGVMTLAGKGPEVHLSPTDDMGKILNALHDVHVFGKQPTLADGVQVAALALKHRMNKNGGQRIVVFIGSPIDDIPKALTKAGKILKKNNIAVDIVSFGEIDDNQEKLEAFIAAVNSDNNSHLITIPTGCVPSDILVSSPIVNEGMSGAGPSSTSADMGGEASHGGMADFVDPNMDPELAMALRVSMEEERARQEREAASNPTSSEPLPPTMEVDETQPEPLDSSEPQPHTSEPQTTQEPASSASADDEMDEDALLQQALALSMAEAGEDQDEMQQALQMSMAMDTSAPAEEAPAEKPQPTTPASTTTTPQPPAATGAPAASQLNDPNFVSSMLASLPGVDPNDPRIQMALQQIRDKQNDEKKDDSNK